MGETARKINTRDLALGAVTEILDRGCFCDRALDGVMRRNPGLTKQERSFVTRLCQGCVERCITLDYVISQFSKTPPDKLRPIVRNVLRITVYQLLYMDQAADFAACDEAVKLVRKRGLQGLSGFVNAVCRNIARSRGSLFDALGAMDERRRLSISCSMPQWIIDEWARDYSMEDIEGALKYFLEEKATCIRCNESIVPPGRLRGELEGCGVCVRESANLPGCFKISGYDTLDRLESFRQGHFIVQDESSALAAAAAGVKPGGRVLDVCAAPGGKTLAIADRLKCLEAQGCGEARGLVTACDISESKLSKLRENVMRCGFDNVRIMLNDAERLNESFVDSADVVIADLPCSGLGIIGKKPDIKYRVTPEKLEELSRLQRNMLKTVSRYVKRGGTLIFSTCTVSRRENGGNAEFLRRELGFEPIPLDSCLPPAFHSSITPEGTLQLLPGRHGTDGFFISGFKRG